jgi:Transmembrane secretion effector
MSLAGLLWGVLATALDFKWVLFSASALGIASALTARRLSIDFSAEIDQEAHPLEQEERPLYLPESDDGPITITLEIEVAPENHIQFFRLVKEVRLVFLRNGAFSARLDQDMKTQIDFVCRPYFPRGASTSDSVNESRAMNTLCGRNSGPRTPGRHYQPPNTTSVFNTGYPKSQRCRD